MLIFYATLIIPALNSAIGVENLSTIDSLSPILEISKRGIVERGYNTQDYKFRQPKGSNPSVTSTLSPQNDNTKSLSYYKDVKPGVQKVPHYGSNYDSVFKPSPYVGQSSAVRQPESQRINERSKPYSENLFSVSGGYKVANNAKLSKQINVAGRQGQRFQAINYPPSQDPFNRNPAIGIGEAPSANIQVPVYKTSYPVLKPEEYLQMHPSALQTASHSVPSFKSFNNPTVGKKPSSPVLRLDSNQNLPAYFHTFESQPLVLSPVIDRSVPNKEFNFGARTSRPNVVQPSAPFLAPFSSFQGQVVPIQTSGSNPQFPQYRGASIPVYPTVDAIPKAPGVYQSLQTQPLLHFERGNVQPIRNFNAQRGGRHFAPAEEIRTDVEVIDKKKPTPPPPRKDDDDDEEVNDDDEGYKGVEKEYNHDSEEDDDYEHRPRKYFKESPTESDFKPSKSFPFKQYDDTFGRYSKQDNDKETERKPFSKYRDYSSSNDDDEDDEEQSSKVRSESTSSRSPYNRYDEEDEEDDGEDEEEGDSQKYERLQKAEENSDYGYKSKPHRYYDVDFGREFEESYKKELPRQRYVHVKEVPEIEYESKSRRQQNSGRSENIDDESEEPSGEGSHASYKYQKMPKTHRGSSGSLTKTIPKVVHEETFGYKNPEKGKHSTYARSSDGKI